MLHDIFHNNLKSRVYGRIYSYKYCRLLLRIHHRLFCEDNFTSKNFKKLSLVEPLFNIRDDYSLQTTTLLNCVTDDFMRAFWNSYAENFGKLSQNHMQWSFLLTQLYEYSLQSTGELHYRYILEVLRKERMF